MFRSALYAKRLDFRCSRNVSAASSVQSVFARLVVGWFLCPTILRTSECPSRYWAPRRVDITPIQTLNLIWTIVWRNLTAMGRQQFYMAGNYIYISFFTLYFVNNVVERNVLEQKYIKNTNGYIKNTIKNTLYNICHSKIIRKSANHP